MSDQLEQTAREALVITAGLRKSLPEANCLTVDIDKLNALAQGYLDLLAENEKLKSALKLEKENNFYDKGYDTAYCESLSKITQLKSENEKLCWDNTELQALAMGTEELNKKLQSDRAKLVEGLKFYADRKNWFCGTHEMICDLVGVEDCDEFKGRTGAQQHGGKTARAVLAELGEK